MKIIDINAGMGFWPIQRFSDRSLPELDCTFGRLSIDEVWLSAIESILFPEPDLHDWALFKRLKEFPRFRPVKTVNPLLGNWKESIQQAVSHFGAVAIKLFPNYHNYSLKSEAIFDMCRLARENHLPILIQMRVNDERNQPAVLQVKSLLVDDVAEFAATYPENLIIALCAFNNEVTKLSKGGENLLIDLSFLDEAESIEQFADIIDLDRFVFGSHSPFLHAHAACLKLTHFKLSEWLQKGVAADNLRLRYSGRMPCEH